MSEPENMPYCVQSSLAAGEPLYATMTQAGVWFLLEYNRTWEHEAVTASDIPSAVKQRLQSMEGARLQLIRQPALPGWDDHRYSFFIATSLHPQPKLYHIPLQEYEEILSLDLEAIIEGQHPEHQPLDRPLYIVCVNGRHDVCCSQYGAPLYNALVEAAGTDVWQCTHIGGHRFAGTMVCLPHGIGYGRLSPEDASRVVQSFSEGRLLLEHYRGRSALPPESQAAEYFVRLERGLDHIDALSVEGGAALENGREVALRFADGSSEKLHIYREMSDFRVLKSSGVGTPEQVPVYRRIRPEDAAE